MSDRTANLVYFPQSPKLNGVARRNGNFPAAPRGPVTEPCMVTTVIRLITRDGRYEKQQTIAGQLLFVEPLIILLSWSLPVLVTVAFTCD